MSTQSTTLPAIRALLWERWRVMRWLLLGMLGTFFAWFLIARMLLEFEGLLLGPEHRENFIEVIQTAWGPAWVFMFALLSLMHPLDTGATMRPLPRHFRLPLRTRSMVAIQLTAQWMGIAALVFALWLTNIAVLGPGAMENEYAYLVLLLAAVLVSTWAHAFAMMLPDTRVFLVGVGILFTLSISGTVPLTALERVPVPAYLAGIAIGLVLSVAGARTARSGLFTGVMAGRWPERRAAIPHGLILPSPIRAMLWHEWRVWGRWFVLAAIAGHGFMFAVSFLADRGGQLGWASSEVFLTVPWTLVWMAFVTGLLLAVRDGGLGKHTPSALRLALPVGTVRMARARMAVQSVILLIALLAVASLTVVIMVAAWAGGISGVWNVHLDDLLLTWAAHAIVTWLFLVAAWPMLIGGVCWMVLAVLIEVVVLLGWIETPTDLAALVIMGLTLAFLLATAIAARRAGILGRWMTAASVATAILCVLAFAFGVPLIMNDAAPALAPRAVVILWAVSAGSMALLYPFIWQPLWLHQCRHGRLGGRFRSGSRS